MFVVPSVTAQDKSDVQEVPAKAFTDVEGEAEKVQELTSKQQLQRLLRELKASEPSVGAKHDGPRLYSIPGRYVVRGRVPGYRTKAPDELSTDWYSFSLFRSWSGEIFEAGGKLPKVVAVGRLYYQTSYEYQEPDRKGMLMASRGTDYKQGDQVPAEFRFKVDEVWIRMDLRDEEEASKPK
ncbi:hypothetical protein [Aeoliella sp.]|uniref:hypothetical protein n=1 Tax=Aeoliella sp. TaxID=2795800 RepID=UPI003CCBE060